MAAKKSAKKSAAKKSARKSSRSTVSRSASAKKSSRKSTSRSKSSSYKVPAVPLRSRSVSTISTTPAAKPSRSTSSVGSYSGSSSSAKKSNNGVVVAVVLGILILGIAVIAKNNSKSESTTVTPSASASASAGASASASASASAGAELADHSAPNNFIYALKDGMTDEASFRWKAATASEGVTGYLIETRVGTKGEWQKLAQVSATTFSYDIKQTSNDSGQWSQARISTVYSDGKVVTIDSSKIFGLPGIWS